MIIIRFLLCLFAVLSLSLCQPLGKEERHRLVVVGAGVSGFAAATSLLANNFTDFVVLEASDRVGGRIHTVEFGGVLIDRGAEFVHGEKNNVVFELVSPHNLIASYMPLMTSEKQLFADITGHKYNSTLVDTVLSEARDIPNEYPANVNGSAAEYLYPKLEELFASHSLDPELAVAIRHLVTERNRILSPADSLEQLGALGESKYMECEGDQAWKWKPGTQGYKTIFDILSKKFPNPSEELPVMEKISLKKEVQRIEREESSGEVVLSCADGSSYRADHVIVTVSLGVLKKHAVDMFHPPLPQKKTDAIQSIGIGCVGKVWLLFPTRWWPTDINAIVPLFTQKQLEDFQKNTTYGYWTGNSSGFYPVMNHDRILITWFSGPYCRTMETMTDEQVIDGLMELLNAIVGQQFQIPRPESILRTDWGSYKYTLGAYSFPTVESDRLIITRLHLSEPLFSGDKPVVMFAGEATNNIHWSTVHGALTSGRREADRLLQYIRAQS